MKTRILFATLFVLVAFMVGSVTMAFVPVAAADTNVEVYQDPDDDQSVELPDFEAMPVEDVVAWIIGAMYGILQVFVPGISIFELFKRLFKLQDFWANIAVIVLAVLVAVGAMYLAGVLEWANFTVQSVLGLAFSIYTASQAAYTQLRKHRETSLPY